MNQSHLVNNEMKGIHSTTGGFEDRSDRSTQMLNVLHQMSEVIEQSKQALKNEPAFSIKMADSLLGLLNLKEQEIAEDKPELKVFTTVVREVLHKIQDTLSEEHLTDVEKQKTVTALVVFVLSLYQDVQNGAPKVAEEHLKELIFGTVMLAGSLGNNTKLARGTITSMELLHFSKEPGMDREALMNEVQTLFTMAPGAKLDQGLAKVLKETVQEAVDQAMQAKGSKIQEAAENAAIAAGKENDLNAIINAKDLHREVSKATAKQAVERALERFLNQPFAHFALIAVTGKFREKLFREMVRSAAFSIDAAIEETTSIAKLEILGVETAPDVIDEIAVNAAEKAG